MASREVTPRAPLGEGAKAEVATTLPAIRQAVIFMFLRVLRLDIVRSGMVRISVEDRNSACFVKSASDFNLREYLEKVRIQMMVAVDIDTVLIG